MTMRKLAATLFLTAMAQLFAIAPNAQQQGYWIAIEVHRNLELAIRRARFVSDDVPKTRVFQLKNGSYAVVAGTYDQFDASSIRQQLVAEGVIPSESYATAGSNFDVQVWPPIDEMDSTGTATDPDAEIDHAQNAEELAEHLAHQMAIQRVLKYFGDYKAKIDGVFGKGTFAAIAAFQERNGFAATGSLTPEQEKHLFDTFKFELTESGLHEIADPDAGITVALPIDLIRFSSYDPPFAIYDPVEGQGIQVLLISMVGNASTLKLLHEIMQLSGRIPTGSQSYVDRDSFVISSDAGDMSSYTYAGLRNGRIKGFSVAWQQADDLYSREIVPKMLASFHELDERTLDDRLELASSEEVSELISGIKRHEPAQTASGFFVDRNGSVVTAANTVGDCKRIFVSPNHNMEVKVANPEMNLAVLSPLEPLAPLEFARFQENAPKRGSRVAVSGYSFEGDLGAPTLTYGHFASHTGPDGGSGHDMLRIRTLPGDVGGPVLDQAGAVVGMLMPKLPGDRVIPENVQVSLSVGAIRDLVATSDIDITFTGASRKLDPVLLERRATEITVLIECY